jgi:hypothetical protein
MHQRRPDTDPNAPQEGERVVFTTQLPDRQRNATRGVTEALFKSSNASFGSAAEIEANLRNRELGFVGEKNGATVVQMSSTVTTTVVGPGESREPREPRKSGKGAGQMTPDEAFRALRSDEAFLRLKARFDATQSANDALAVAKYCVPLSTPDAERFFKEAVAADPANGRVCAHYAVFLETVTCDFDRAEKMHQQAALSGDRKYIRAYAAFVREVRGDERLADKIERAGEAAGEGNDERRVRHHRRRSEKSAATRGDESQSGDGEHEHEQEQEAEPEQREREREHGGERRRRHRREK